MSDLAPLGAGTVLTSRVQVVAGELRALWEARGQLVAADIVDAARPEDSPLHGFFLWDDTEAAERYRRLQAGELVRSVRVLVQDHDTDVEVRSWIAVNRDGSGYVPTEVVGANPDQRERVLRRMHREVAALRRRYQNYAEFWAEIGQLAREDELAG